MISRSQEHWLAFSDERGFFGAKPRKRGASSQLTTGKTGYLVAAGGLFNAPGVIRHSASASIESCAQHTGFGAHSSAVCSQIWHTRPPSCWP
jgi:hypothetical protein